MEKYRQVSLTSVSGKIMEQNLLETHQNKENKEVIGDSQNGFTHGKSCLTNLATFYDRATALEDGARAADTIHLDSSKVFGTVLHDILVSKLEKHGFDGWAALWIKNWLDGCTQSCCQGSIWTPVMRVFQLGLILFNTFISNMDSGIECQFALDTELCGVVNMLERREVLQTDLDTLEKWEHANLTKFNKVQGLTLGSWQSQTHQKVG